MTIHSAAEGRPRLSVDQATELTSSDLDDLCDAAEAAIQEGGGFGWLTAPRREVFERYWRGVLMVPERTLFLARMDGMIAGAAQLLRPPRSNEAQAHLAWITGAFIAPWARGHGLGRMTARRVEQAARARGVKVLNLDLRATQDGAITMYERLGFIRWATHPYYAFVDGAFIEGYYYTKLLTDLDDGGEASVDP